MGGRRRRRGGIWLPTLGTVWEGGEESYHDSSFNIFTAQLLNNRADGNVSQHFAIVPDFTFQASEAVAGRQATLADRTSGNEWFLDSIVGNCHVHVQDLGPDEGQWNYVQVTAGFFVARSEDGDDGSPDLFTDELDPQNVDNIQQPWIWRRTWLLTNPAGTGVMRDDFPIANSEMGDLSGPHIHTKSKRRIRREHRLWFVLAARGWNGESISSLPLSTQPVVSGILDVRVFGRTIRNGKNGSSF